VSQETAQTIDIDEIIDRYPSDPQYLIFLLQDIQAAFNYISPEALSLVSDHTGVPLSRVYAVATFYQSFSLEPKGEHEIRLGPCNERLAFHAAPTDAGGRVREIMEIRQNIVRPVLLERLEQLVKHEFVRVDGEYCVCVVRCEL